MKEKKKNIEVNLPLIIFIGMIVIMCFGIGYFISNSQQIKVMVLKNVYDENPLNETLINRVSEVRYELPYYLLEPEQFKSIIDQEYRYSDETDCRYWSYVWYAYFKSRTETSSIDIITTENHVFVIAGDVHGYYLADLNRLIRISEN